MMPDHASAPPTKSPFQAPELARRSPNNSLLWAFAKSTTQYVSRYIWLTPLLNFLYVCCFWLLTSILLGEWARPGVHDPKDVLGGVPNSIHIALMILSIGVLPVVLSCGFARNRFRGLTYYLIAFLSCLAVSAFLFRLDLWQMTSWISD